MADTRRDIILSTLEGRLNYYINDYEAHQNYIKDCKVPVKAFFDAIHYVKTRHGEKGYKQRTKFIAEARQSSDYDSLLAVMRIYHNDNNSGPHTKNVIRTICLNEFNITQAMIDELAKSNQVPKQRSEYGSETYESPGPQRIAKKLITNLILDGDVDEILKLRNKSLNENDDEIQMKLYKV